MQLQVLNSPFSQEQVDLLGRLLPTLTGTQQVWLSGYLTALQGAAQGSAAAAPAAAASTAVAEPAPVSKEVTVLFGSQTGNSQSLAKKLARKLEESGFQTTLSVMRDFKPNTLKKVRNLLVIVSTQGEGDPPDNAMSFYEFLHSKRAPQLDDLRFSVLALGDTTYEQFCQTGKDFDRRLGELGGQRISPRVDCDVDFDEPAATWMESVIGSLAEAQQQGAAASAPPAGIAGAFVAAGSAPLAESSPYSRTNPFHAEVLDNINLNGRGSDLETRHLALSLEGSGLEFEPGDVLGIYPENHPELVDALIAQMGWNPSELVPANKQGELCKLREALLAHYDISVLSKALVEQLAPLSASDKLREWTRPGHEQELKAYVKGRDLLDLAQDFAPWQATPGEFVSLLRKLPARQYSIASSYKANPDEVHLTIRAVRYEAHGRTRYGVCSTHVADRVQPGDKLPIYVQHNEHFRLPADPDAPIIMIGPGTGVAPFRAFMEERAETGVAGKSWLFYGDRRFRTDFLYQVEWQRWLQDGVLTRMDVAFSRDTANKVYVQHRMMEKSADLYAWLQDGATVYVCGDKDHMAKDVHETLIAIVEKEGGRSREAAEAFIADLQQQGRYLRDVY